MSIGVILNDAVFKLPSGGKGYANSKINLIEGHSVRIIPFMAGVQRYLVAPEGQEYIGYCNVVRKIMIEPKMEVLDNFLVSDLNAILFAAFMMSYRNLIYYQGFCSKCGDITLHEVNLEKVQVVMSDEIPDYKASGLSIQLPESKQTVTFHLPTLQDEKKVHSFYDTLVGEKLDSGEKELDMVYIRPAQYLDTVNGAPMPGLMDKFEFVTDHLSVVDFDTLVTAINKSDTGILVTQTSECVAEYQNKATGELKECRNPNPRTKLVITPQFFRPPNRSPGLVDRETVSTS